MGLLNGLRLLSPPSEHIEVPRLRTSHLRLDGCGGDREGSQLLQEGCAEGCEPTELEGEVFEESLNA